MPKLPSSATAELPKHLRAFRFHGLDFDYEAGQEDVYADCPFCDRDGKLGIAAVTGVWQCLGCGAAGNPLTFVRQLWDASDKSTKDYSVLAADRRLLYPETLEYWGVAKSVTTGWWLVPGYGIDGKLNQLYQYRKVTNKEGRWVMRLLPTPDLWAKGEASGLFGLGQWNAKKPLVYLTEGPWDGAALWEILRRTMVEDGGKLSMTGNDASSLYAEANVVAIPGAMLFIPAWLPLFAGKRVILCFDNDHGRDRNGKREEGAGFRGMRRTAKLLAGSRQPPESIAWLKWGVEDGYYEPNLDDGYDVRDLLADGGDPSTSESAALSQRITNLNMIIDRLEPIPADWVPGRTAAAKAKGGTEVELLDCVKWDDLIQHWRRAIKWREAIEDALATMLAVVVSTVQTGSQIFLQVIADAGSAKTRLCDAMLANKEHCVVLEHLTGFHSGWKDGSGEDFSLLTRVNRKVMITPEGDVMMTNPKFAEIMAQVRRIFDGSSNANYKHMKEAQSHTGLRTPWIIAGTPVLMNADQSRVGDRFIRVFIDPPGEQELEDILDRVYYNADRAVLQESNGCSESVNEESMGFAYRATGGYVKYLRENSAKLLAQVEVDHTVVLPLCKGLAKFVADLRARPEPEPRLGTNREATNTKELPTRLLEQFTRLARCLAAAMGRRTIDADVRRRLVKVARDTAKGKTQEIVRHLAATGREGMALTSLMIATGEDCSRLEGLLLFIKRNEVVELYNAPTVLVSGRLGLRTTKKWRLTERFAELWRIVVGGGGTGGLDR